MQHWVFQANPDRFDVDQYVTRQDDILWSVGQSHFRDQINLGDKVYIWRAKGKRFINKVYGIIAEGTISGPPEVLQDDCPDLWRSDDALQESLQLRVPVSITRRCVRDGQVIQAHALAQDPVTSGLKIQKMRNLTNYLITESEAEHISRLISNVAIIKSQPPYNSTYQRPSYREFGDAPNDDPRELQNFAKRVRRGQRAFRDNLLRAYENRCSITGEGPEEVLEAVHIVPHAESGINELDNGLLMRADLHYLFDDGLLSINSETRNIELDDRLQNTSCWQFNGAQLRLRSDGTQISSKYLKERLI